MLAYYKPGVVEAGCDEAGRGALAGPVVAAAVILPPDFPVHLLRDSKQLSAAQRNRLRSLIEKQALSFGVGVASVAEINRYNILKATYLAMHRALDQLSVSPEVILVDGNQFCGYRNKVHHCLVQGDAMYASIAAASILAKTYRDEQMLALHRQYPVYGWASNKGYATVSHRNVLRRQGPCRQHRKLFLRNIVPMSLSMQML